MNIDTILAKTPFVSIRELASLTGIGEKYIRKRVKEKSIPFVLSGVKALIPVELFIE